MNLSMRSNFRMLVLLLLMLLPSLLYSQDRSLHYGMDLSALSAGSGEDLPFWFYANTGGGVDGESSNLLSRLYSFYGYRSKDRSLRINTGFDFTARLSDRNSLFFKQLYGSVGYEFLTLRAGRFYDRVGLTDDDLSMGSMQVSRNATPVPKVQLQTDGFTDVPFAGGYVQFKSMLSHGWLEADRYVKNAYLHQKYFYLKINYRMFEGMGGIIHNVMWGGTHPSYGPLPSSFNDFTRVLLGTSASADSNAPTSDITNVIGNSVAAYDFRLNINLENFRFKAYRQFYLEDKVSAQFRSPWDGIWGAGIELVNRNSIVNEILWEHMNTKRQDAFDWEPRGVATYYHNGIYSGGWAYENRVLGNPLILYGSNPNFLSRGNIANNIIVAHHIGIKGRPTKRLRYKAFLTYSRNYGTVRDQTKQTPHIPISELRIDEYSALLEGHYLLSPAHDISLTTAVAFDIGRLYGENRLGLQLGLSWNKIGR